MPNYKTTLVNITRTFNIDPTSYLPTTIKVGTLGTGTADSSTFLRGDGTWATVSGSGTVTSVGMTVPTGLSVSGSPITSSGTLAVSWQGQIPTTSLGTGTADNTKFLRGDGTWAVPSAGFGTVTSVALSAPQGLAVTGSPITIAGTLGLAWSGRIPTSSLGLGTADSTVFLRGDSTWASIPATGGSVTSVSMTVPTGFSITGSPITTAGTLALTYNGLIPVTSLGTGTPNATTFLAGDGTWRTVSGSGSIYINSSIVNNPNFLNSAVTGSGTAWVANGSNVLATPSMYSTTTNAVGQWQTLNVSGSGVSSANITNGVLNIIVTGGSGGGGAGTVTSVTSQLSGLSFGLNTSTTPILITQNVGASPTTVFLRGDGAWGSIPYTGTVTSVAMTVPQGFAIAGSPITTTGTLALTYSGYIPTSSLGSGTANVNTFLRGDQSWAVINLPTGNNILSGNVTPTTTNANTGDWYFQYSNATGSTWQATQSAYRYTGTGWAEYVLTGTNAGTANIADPLTGTLLAQPKYSIYIQYNGGSRAIQSLYRRISLGGLASDYEQFVIPQGTVTSLGISMPSEFAVANSPVTTAGTITITKATQAVNTFYAGPSAGATAVPSFRAITTSDLGTGTANANVWLRGDLTWNAPVSSFAKTGGSVRTGAIRLTEGLNVTITDNNDGSYTISSTGGGGAGGFVSSTKWTTANASVKNAYTSYTSASTNTVNSDGITISIIASGGSGQLTGVTVSLNGTAVTGSYTSTGTFPNYTITVPSTALTPAQQVASSSVVSLLGTFSGSNFNVADAGILTTNQPVAFTTTLTGSYANSSYPFYQTTATFNYSYTNASAILTFGGTFTPQGGTASTASSASGSIANFNIAQVTLGGSATGTGLYGFVNGTVNFTGTIAKPTVWTPAFYTQPTAGNTPPTFSTSPSTNLQTPFNALGSTITYSVAGLSNDYGWIAIPNTLALSNIYVETISGTSPLVPDITAPNQTVAGQVYLVYGFTNFSTVTPLTLVIK